MLSYIDTYNYRVTKYGKNHKQREYNYGLRDFDKYLAESPSSQPVTVDGTEMLASIISNRQDEFKLTKQILTKVGTAIGPGSMVTWGEENWIVYQRVRQPNETYVTCYMVRCNNSIAWVDEYGVKHTRYCYVVGAEDSKIKANFRTWNGMITPQPNQYLQMLVPSDDSIKISQKFIIDERAWFVVEFDKTSAPGITYFSLTEDKVDRLDDDVENQLANYKQVGSVTIEMSDIMVAQGDSIVLNPLIYNDGVLQDYDITYTIADESMVSINADGASTILTGLQLGSTTIEISLTDQPAVTKTINVTITESSTKTQYIFDGTNSLRISETASYTVYEISAEKTLIPITAFTLSNDLVSGKLSSGILVLAANEKNNIGQVVLTVTTASGEFTKTIQVHSLW